ncbi:DUF2169 domain-containing protein [Luteolibacter sp. Populi]|uniref:DUF2169 family type VI secretion system accessory protein n=1 Tax=Luteolibacter sp. Populi TaxID=3230487 RepID=UPI003465AA61
MDFVNQTKLAAGWTMGFRKDGRELMVVAAKGTFMIPSRSDQEPVLATAQVPLVTGDTFTGEPGFSAVEYEVDYAHLKPACDVLVNGCAYAPGGRPASCVPVALVAGPIRKHFEVIGERRYELGILGSSAPPPKPFVSLPISYDKAYGGADHHPREPDKVRTYADNPVGVGYYPLTQGHDRSGKPLACTREPGKPADDPNQSYRPMAFGPMGRNFKDRYKFAGTYDKNWQDHRAPFFPADFDYRYFQAAPEDQQMPYPQGGETILLENLSPRGRLVFALPRRSVPVLFIPYRGQAYEQQAVIDTVVIEPEFDRFTMTWRTSAPMGRSCFDLMRVVVGRGMREHVRDSRRGGKRHFKNLAEFIRWKRTR